MIVILDRISLIHEVYDLLLRKPLLYLLVLRLLFLFLLLFLVLEKIRFLHSFEGSRAEFCMNMIWLLKVLLLFVKELSLDIL